MDQEDEQLAKEDGRYFAIGKVGTTDLIGSVATTERLGKIVVGFGLPSAPALFLHLAHTAYMKIKDVDPLRYFDEHPAPQGRYPDDSKALFDFFEQAISHVVFAFTALEAFANEVIPEGHVYTRPDDKKGITVTYQKEEIERNVSLDEKLQTVLPPIHSVPPPKGTQVWERFKQIKTMRDRIIHLKAADRRTSGPEDETLWGDLLRNHNRPYCDYAYEMMRHFGQAITIRRWFKEYPPKG